MGIASNNNKIATVADCNSTGGSLSGSTGRCPTCGEIKASSNISANKTVRISGVYANNQLVKTADIDYLIVQELVYNTHYFANTGGMVGSSPHHVVRAAFPDGISIQFWCGEDITILDALDELNYPSPFSCRAGACCSCVAKLLIGSIDQSEQTTLYDTQIEDGLCLLCVAYPKSDCTILVGYGPMVG